VWKFEEFPHEVEESALFLWRKRILRLAALAQDDKTVLPDKQQFAGKCERTVNFEGGIYKNTLSCLRNLTGMV
jgi:hypothetical protein